jgi:hypothetical protein
MITHNPFSVSALVSFLFVFAASPSVFAQIAAGTFSFQGPSSTSGTAGTMATLHVRARLSDYTDPIQGLVMAADVVGGGQFTDLTFNPTTNAELTSADIVVTRRESSYFVAGIVIDTDGSGPEAVSPPGPVDIVELELKGTYPAAGVTDTWTLTYQDGMYNTVDSGPLLDNITVVGGLSLGEGDGLNLLGYSVDVTGLRSSPGAIPEPSGFGLAALGLFSLLSIWRRRRR